MLKLIAIDMDGTLLDDNKKMSSENIKALEKLHNDGVEIVIATGRNYVAAKPYIDQINYGVVEFLICNNGATIYNLKNNEILFNNTLSKEQINEIIKLDDYLNDIDFHYVGDDTIYTYKNPIGKYIIMDAYLSFTEINLVSKKELINNKNLNKALMTGDKNNLPKIISRIPKQYFNNYNIVMTSDNYIEILNKDIDKGTALRELMKKLNITKDKVVTIGDQQNDIGMFVASGISYCMKEAPEIVKNKSDFIGPSNNNSGVAKIIYELYEKENL